MHAAFDMGSPRAWVVAVFWICSSAAALDVTDIPSPRPTGWVSDSAHAIPAGLLAELNTLGDRVRRESGAELAVVTIRSLGGQEPRAFATRLFNHWGVGHATRNNGILIFAALDDRKAEIVLGTGIDRDTQVAAAQRIFDQEMVPRFRSGRPGEALLAAAKACARDILLLPAAAPITEVDEGVLPLETPAQPNSAAEPDSETLPAVDTTQPAPRLEITYIPDPASSVPATPSSHFPWLVLAIPGVLGGGVGLYYWLRYRARRCASCRLSMQRLSEAADDEHLNAKQRTEERLGSVDYDVWQCPECRDIKILRWGALFSSYGKCPSCHGKTKHSQSTTVRHATYDHGGLVHVDEQCRYCSYRNSYTYRTARKTRSSSGGGSSFGGSSSLGGGRSSGGGGFGGGRSGGRGGGGGW
ncbi:MAG: hypothetical protein AMXMBFR7_29010 [Planctomycetota bacterium]